MAFVLVQVFLSMTGGILGGFSVSPAAGNRGMAAVATFVTSVGVGAAFLDTFDGSLSDDSASPKTQETGFFLLPPLPLPLLGARVGTPGAVDSMSIAVEELALIEQVPLEPIDRLL